VVAPRLLLGLRKNCRLYGASLFLSLLCLTTTRQVIVTFVWVLSFRSLAPGTACKPARAGTIGRSGLRCVRARNQLVYLICCLSGASIGSCYRSAEHPSLSYRLNYSRFNIIILLVCKRRRGALIDDPSREDTTFLQIPSPWQKRLTASTRMDLCSLEPPR
jgi:hypothetical protein